MGRQRGIVYSDSVLVVYGREALPAERKAAERLAHLLAKRTGVRTLAVDDQRFDPAGWQALVLVGHPDRQLVGAALMASHGIRRPSEVRPGPEGYVVQWVGRPNLPTMVIAGSGHACLYGVGAFLRALDLERPGQVGIPYLRVGSAPAFPVRGTDVALRAEQWTLERWEDHIADLALSGVNLIRRSLFGGPLDTWLDEQEWMIEDGPGRAGWEMEKQINRLVHDYGLQAGIHYPPNTVATAITRADWHPGSTWPRLVCPSLPAARDRILYERLVIFKELEHIDHLFIPPNGGAGGMGGCSCATCRPWPRTFLELVKHVAGYLHRYHPNAQVWISNDGLSAQESEWLWDQLSREQPDWLQVVQYSPATHAFLPESDWFGAEGEPEQERNPAVWMLTRNLQETARRIPAVYSLVLSPDVTHTFQPQYGLERIDPALLRLHTPESPFARPRAYDELFRATASAGAGVVLGSRGLHDDLNKALWMSWAWSPELSPWNATLGYARWWFGERAAQLAAEAILLSEANWEQPLVDNEQIEQVVLLLDQAEVRIPEHLLEDNWRWTLWRLRALLDMLAQQKLRTARQAHREASELLVEVSTGAQALSVRVERVCELLDLERREASLAFLKKEIRDLDNRLFHQAGMHLPAVANLDAELDNHSWEQAQFRQALDTYNAGGAEDRAGLHHAVMSVLHYQDPGPGGFYDDCGHIGRDPHFVSGHRVPLAAGLDPANRPSANTVAVSLVQGDDIVFAYEGLHPEVDYEVRLMLVSPEFNPGLAYNYGAWRGDMCAVQRLYASGFLVHDALRLPQRVARHFTFGLPRQAYADGRLELRFVPAAPGQVAAVSEIWVIRGPGPS